jgi:hypothetical protein
MRYLIHFFVAVGVLAGALVGFNAWVDPYAVFRDEFRDGQPRRIMSERIFKTVALVKAPADVVFLGTSRTDLGIGPDQTALPGKRIANVAIFDQPIQETRRLVERMLATQRPETLVVGLDFFAFNALRPYPSDYTDANYDAMRKAGLLLSVSTLTDAISHLRHPQPGPGDCCHATGFHLESPADYARGDYHHRFIGSERLYLREKYLPYPACSFGYVRAGQDGSTLEDLRAILDVARQNHVDLRLFISPAHARQWETVAAAGLWDAWEEWKRALVRINDESAMRGGGKPFPLWDFSGYDEVSSEAVPEDGSGQEMRNYSDSSHYTPLVGRRMVARMFGADDGWGVRLDAADIESHLVAIRRDRERYRLTHAEDVAQIGRLAQTVAREKHCPERAE